VALFTDEKEGPLMAGVEDHGMDHHECSDMPSMAVTFPGPFEHHDVVVNGWRVPLLQAHPQGEDRVRLVLDRRLGAEFTACEAERVIPFLADAIAVALGYGCHPRHAMDEPAVSAPVRPRRVSSLVAASAEDGAPTA
jgi:hypothetical protein